MMEPRDRLLLPVLRIVGRLRETNSRARIESRIVKRAAPGPARVGTKTDRRIAFACST